MVCDARFATYALRKAHFRDSPACLLPKAALSALGSGSGSSSGRGAAVPSAPHGGAGGGRASATVINATTALALRHTDAVTGTRHHSRLAPGASTVTEFVSITTRTVSTAPAASTAAVRRQLPKQMLFLLDDSSSMRMSTSDSATRFQEAVLGAQSLLDTLNDWDWVGLFTFSGTLKQVVAPSEMRTARADMVAALSRMHTDGPRGRTTNLFSSIVDVASRFDVTGKSKKVQFELVVLTDGRDSGLSGVTPDLTQAQLASLKTGHMRNLHVTLLAVSLSDAALADMTRAMTDNVGRVYPVASSAGAIKSVFGTVVRAGIAARTETITQTVVTKRMVKSRGAGSAL